MQGQQITIREFSNYAGQQVRVGAWIANTRSSGKIRFLQLRDGSGRVQAVVVKSAVTEDVWQAVTSLTQESSVWVEGTVREEPRSPSGFELDVVSVEIIQLTEGYPITPKEHGIDFLMDHRHLWLRSPKQHAILKIRACLIRELQGYLDGKGFTRVDPPILTPSACEGTTDLFHTKYFEQDAYLTQSGQLYMEAAAMALGKVYSFGPTFRAEKSKTRRHLLEFWMLEPEMAFIRLEDNLAVQEALIQHAVRTVMEQCQRELQVLERDQAKLQAVLQPFPRIRYDEAIEWLRANGHEIAWGDDFGSPHETALADHHSCPVFITHYPAAIKAFYMKPDPERPEVVQCADLLAPEGYGEIIGGSQRIDDPALLAQRFAEHELPEADYLWYLELRKFGSVPHGGFGLGLERLVAWICGLDHVRETIAFPRMLYRFYP